MSLYNRLDLTKPTTHKLNVPLSQRLNLAKPPKLHCKGCHIRIQFHWESCPCCGKTLRESNGEIRRCIWIDVAKVNVTSENQELVNAIFLDALSKLYGAFRSVQVFLTSEAPEPHIWAKNFTHIHVFVDGQEVDYLGIASFKLGMVTDCAFVRLDKIFNAAYDANLSINQLSNLIANTIAHEVGHTLGLAHSKLSTNVMCDGLDHVVHSLMPPSFYAEQINSMNNAICHFKLD